MGALVRGQVEFVARLHAERCVPGIDVGQGSVDALLVGRVYIAVNQVSYKLRGHVAGPDANVREEESPKGWSFMAFCRAR